MPEDIQIAAERARLAVGEKSWRLLSLHEQTNAIYRELRALDAERLLEQAEASGFADLSQPSKWKSGVRPT